MSCPFKKDGSGEDAAKATMHYSSILQLDKLLSAQQPVSQNAQGRTKPVHDEHLFIVVHQVFELWFKQVLVELFSVRHILLETVVDEGHMLAMTTRLSRVVMIMKLFVDQFAILETMTPMDFLDFRDMLAPASGFQSLQFRVLENLLGVKKENRVSLQPHYSLAHKGQAEKILEESEQETSLLEALEKWLERTPGLDDSGFNFPQRYATAVQGMLAEEHANTQSEELPAEQRDFNRKSHDRDQELFSSLLDAEKHQQGVDRGERRLSHKATLGALMIFLYRDEPRFNEPYKVLQLMMDIDSNLMKWRHNHVAMVQRYLGTRIGTGGSSGYLYLRATVSDRYKVFLDLFNLSSFILPRRHIPPLTDDMRSLLTSHNNISKPESVRDHPCFADAVVGENLKKLLTSTGLDLTTS